MTANKPLDHNARQEKYPNTQSFYLQRPARRADGQIFIRAKCKGQPEYQFLTHVIS
jgi:hypothetical protein